jgi:hypothetical protein
VPNKSAPMAPPCARERTGSRRLPFGGRGSAGRGAGRRGLWN